LNAALGILTAEERREFSTRGLLVVPEALPSDLADRAEAALDEIFRRRRGEGLPEHQHMFEPNFLHRDPVFLELLDCPRVFPKVWGILGWNIFLYHSHCGVNPPLPPDAPPPARPLSWHQDSGRVNVEIECHPRPRLSLKVAYFLSDCSQPGRGNFHVIPGSHLQDNLEHPPDADPPGSLPVCVRRGDAVLFDRRLWHAGSPNTSQITRKALFYGYSYRWLRTKDDMTIPVDWFEAADPIRRQLLGGAVNCNGRYTPTEADVPLRDWLRRHHPQFAE
jgi:ectoine hydroxylase